MIGKMLSAGFNLATMPARLAYRSARAIVMTPAEFNQFMSELRQASEDVTHDIQLLLDSVDNEMGEKAAHLSPVQKEHAAMLALDAAEQHLSMAAVNLLRAFWLAANSNTELSEASRGEIIDHQP